jgi:hypothetical protein
VNSSNINCDMPGSGLVSTRIPQYKCLHDVSRMVGGEVLRERSKERYSKLLPDCEGIIMIYNVKY